MGAGGLAGQRFTGLVGTWAAGRYPGAEVVAEKLCCGTGFTSVPRFQPYLRICRQVGTPAALDNKTQRKVRGLLSLEKKYCKVKWPAGPLNLLWSAHVASLSTEGFSLHLHHNLLTSGVYLLCGRYLEVVSKYMQCTV